LLNDLVVEELPGSWEASLAALNTLIATKYQEQEVPASKRLPKLVKSDITTIKGYPCLKHMKGRKVRQFCWSGL
jgi:hypothetical protein